MKEEFEFRIVKKMRRGSFRFVSIKHTLDISKLVSTSFLPIPQKWAINDTS